MKNSLIIALDTDDVQRARNLAKDLGPYVGGFKIGPRLSLRAEKNLVPELSTHGLVFYDHKFFDIPSTTSASVQAAFELGADWVTIHALCGPSCLGEISRLEKKLRQKKPDFKVCVVTVLTSFSKGTLPPVWKDEPLEKSVETLAASAYTNGLKTFVCSPQEVQSLRGKFKDSFLVVPGIRLGPSVSDDQQRTASPTQALKWGASALVVGRPVIDSADPVGVVKKILGEF